MNLKSRLLVILLVLIVSPVLLFAQAPANDNCSGAIVLTSGNTCNSNTYNLYKATSSSTAGGCGGATISTTYDVWFRFQAVNATTSITLSNLGSQFNKLGNYVPYIEVLSGSSCAGPFTSLGCQAVSTAPGRLTITGLTVGTFYYIRVYVTLAPTATPANKWNFDICVQHQPANDECVGAITLTPGATCSNTTGTLDLSTGNTTGAVIGCWGANTYNDVWYKFTATSTGTYAVTLSNLGANIANPRLQIYSGTCGLLTLLSCATTSALTQAVISGTTYYVRVANTTDPSGTGSGVANFNICVTTSSTAAPANDNCSGAFLLTSGSSCVSVSGTLINATPSGLTSCSGNIVSTSADVWYQFVAQSAYPTITVTAGFPSGGKAGIELYSACGGSPIACSQNPLDKTAVGYPAAGLTVGATYYIRVGINKNIGTPTSGAYGFTICVQDPTSPAVIDYGKSYVDITKGTSGGTIDPGDTLEIRATFVVGGTGAIVDSVAYYDTLRNTRGFALVPGTIALRTNEGKIYRDDPGPKVAYTDAFDSDKGWRSAVGLDTAIQINMGQGASNVARGKIFNTSRPSNFGTTYIVMATYRVVVYGSYGTTINFGGGKFTYRDESTGILSNVSFPTDSLMVYSSPGLCPNAISPTNIVSDEFSGTFGTATTPLLNTRNRGTSPNTNYIYAPFGPPTGGGGPNDYYYGIADNTSGVNPPITTTTLPKPGTGNQRVFNVWDITGDHTGSVNTAKGNPPCDVTQPISATNPCGYMIVFNSSFGTDTAFQYNVSNVCSNTYYEISAWFKNMCYKCACDSNGVSAINAPVGYIPTALNDSSGVNPNIAFAINGIDYYTTGNLQYQGLYPATQTGSDSTNKWQKRGFTYKTGPNQTSFVLTFRNNAPGGGGNDWAMDDVKMATCLPNMQYSPSLNPMVCQANPITINDTITSYFNNYSDYKWQKSTDGGSTWTDVTTATSGTPAWNGSAYQYITQYVIPPTSTTQADSGTLYRVVVATTLSNLSTSSCLTTDGINIINLKVINCGPPLNVDLLSFNGRLDSSKRADLLWVTSKEDEPVFYNVEKSLDGTSFNRIAMISGHGTSNETNYYQFTDIVPVTGRTWYRISIVNKSGVKKYSRIIMLDDQAIDFGLTKVINPFSDKLEFEINASGNSRINANLVSLSGKLVKQISLNVYEGINSLTIPHTESLASGIYILQVKNKDQVIIKKVMKE